MFFSQYGEDEWLANNASLPENGVLVEVGVGNLQTFNNSLYFENRGWPTFLVEPDWRHYEGILKNRPRATLIACALGESAGLRDFVLCEDATLSGFLRTQGTAVKMPVLRLQDLGLPQIDVLSIDTEGTELEVWSGRGALRPKWVIVEYATLFLPDREAEIRERFSADGYRAIHRTACNLILARWGRNGGRQGSREHSADSLTFPREARARSRRRGANCGTPTASFPSAL